MSHVLVTGNCIHCGVKSLFTDDYDCVEHEPLVYISAPEGVESNVDFFRCDYCYAIISSDSRECEECRTVPCVKCGKLTAIILEYETPMSASEPCNDCGFEEYFRNSINNFKLD